MPNVDAKELRTLIEGAPDGFFIHDVEGRILDINARSCADLGYSKAELLKLSIHDIARGLSPAENMVRWANTPPGIAVTFQETVVRKDGSVFPVEISLTCQMVEGRKLFLGVARDISEREAARLTAERFHSELEAQVAQRTAELRRTHARLEAVMDSAQDAISFHDRHGRVLLLNRSAERLAGMSQKEAFGANAIDVFGVEVGGRLRDAEEQVFATGRSSMREEVLPVGGEERIYLVSRSLHHDANDEVAGLISIARDVTELRQGEHEIRKERERLMLAAQVGGIGIWDYDLASDVLHCDDQWYRIMGRDASTPVRSVGEFREFIHPEDVDRATEVEETASRLAASREDYGIVFRIVRPDGEIRWVRSSASIMEDVRGKPCRAIGFVVDMTEAMLAEEHLKQANLSLQRDKAALFRRGEELSRQVGEDPLTAIANRRRFDQELERAFQQAVRDSRPLSLVMIDVDYFKLYNDRYGHVQGDFALRTIAGILASAARRPYDLAARYGDEEFALLLPETDEPVTILNEIATQLALAKLPHPASPVCGQMTLSCGCVIASDLSAITATGLLTEADNALYRAKERGRNCIVVTRL